MNSNLKNDINTYNNGGGQVKVGVKDSGIYIGNTLVAGVKFDIKQLLNNITVPHDYNNVSDNKPRILIINLSDSSDTVLYRDGVQTKIPAQHIEWYSYSLGNNVSYVNEGNTPLQIFQETYFVVVNNGYRITYYKFVARNGDGIIDNEFNTNDYTLMTCIIMNYN